MHHNILVQRYLQLLKVTRPNLVAKKNPEGSLELPHILWMLEKMSSPSYKPLTTHSAWISWVQASLFSHNLINIQHERDITREIMARPPYKHQDYIDTIEHLIQVVEHDLDRFKNITMHNTDNCIMTQIYGDFEAGMEHYFGIEDIFADTGARKDLSNAPYLIEALFGMDSEAPEFIDGLIMALNTDIAFDDQEIDGATWVNNARLIVDLLKDIG